jgi:hypothetical protein
MENRAAVFTSQPQAVEVYQAGTWWAGELLGWRHDARGSCQVWVRVVLGGVEETAWTELTSLRLPERHLAVAEQATGYAPATQEMSVARHPSGRRARGADAATSATAGLPMVRDLSAVPDLPLTGGRRTADETAQFASVGRRRAPEGTEAPSGGRRTAEETAQFASVGRRRAPEATEAPSGGRRRAPETAESPSVGRRRAPDAAPTGSVPAGSAPAVSPGRHRAQADPGVFPAAPGRTRPSAPNSVDGRGRAMPRVPGIRSEEPAARATAGWTAPEGLEPELLTRPMRLSDHVPHARRPRVDGSLRGV